MERSAIPRATLGRLPDYLEFLKGLSPEKTPCISAPAIARQLGLGEVQVRKDLGFVGGQGRPRIGFSTADLIRRLEESLGASHLTADVLVGTGKLGRALLDYAAFEDYGGRTAAAFDRNDRIIRDRHAVEILPMGQFSAFCQSHHIQIGIITVGRGSAREVCDQMIRSGIEAIWNFVPCRLELPPGILLKQENLALSLAHLNHQLCNAM